MLWDLFNCLGTTLPILNIFKSERNWICSDAAKESLFCINVGQNKNHTLNTYLLSTPSPQLPPYLYLFIYLWFQISSRNKTKQEQLGKIWGNFGCCFVYLILSRDTHMNIFVLTFYCFWPEVNNSNLKLFFFVIFCFLLL